jgi:putative chitinase
VAKSLPVLNHAMLWAGASTPARKAAFLATIHNESGFRPDAVERGAFRFRGRGLIQLTGDFNYRQAGTDLGIDLEAKPDLAANPIVSSLVASWYWTRARDINVAADRLDMAAVNIAVGFAPSEREDTERCGDFVRALKWFSGGEVPEGVNCERSFTARLIAAATFLVTRGDAPATPATAATSAPAAPGSTSAPSTPGTSPTTRPPTTRPPTSRPPTTTTTRPPSSTTTTVPPSSGTTTTTTTPESSTTTTTDPPTTTTTSTTTTTTAPNPAPTDDSAPTTPPAGDGSVSGDGSTTSAPSTTATGE